MHQLFVGFKKAYDSVRKEVLYEFVIEFGTPVKLVRLIMCLDAAYSTVRLGKHLSDMFPFKNCLKQGDALSPVLFNCTLGYASRRFQINYNGLKMNGTHQLLDYGNDVNMLGGSVHTIQGVPGECARLRENVPYVKVHRYNPKRLYPKLNGYGDNDERSLKV